MILTPVTSLVTPLMHNLSLTKEQMNDCIHINFDSDGDISYLTCFSDPILRFLVVWWSQENGGGTLMQCLDQNISKHV